MFYLLEDNRIVDSNTLFTKNIPLWEVNDNLLFAKSKNGKLIKPYKYNAIKKQSENVFDLVDWGQDLVKHSANDLIWHCVVLYQTSYISAIDVTTIYKPDDKGNYIKVWEKKYEKNEQR